MVNFLTFDDCDVYPGPNLNIVLGPNGTGKSSLTHAVCLACCGTTADIARSSHLKSFVKKGKEEQDAYVEVDVLDEDDTIVTVRRTLNCASNRSAWVLNNKPATQKAVKDIMLRLSIDVDNLCTFMPQDRVGEFSNFKPEELLHNTLKSISTKIGGKNLFEEQTALANVEKIKADMQRDRDGKDRARAMLEQEVATMINEIDRLKRRQEAIRQLELCQIKQLKVEADELRKKEGELDDLVAQRNAALLVEQAKISPLEAKERELRVLQTRREKAKQDVEKAQTLMQNTLNQKIDHLNDLRNAVNDASEAIAGTLRLRQKIERDLVLEQQTLERNERDLQNCLQSLPVIMQKLEQAQSSHDTACENLEIASVERQEAIRVSTQLSAEVTQLNNSLGALEDSRQVFIKKLEGLVNLGGRESKSYKHTIEAMRILEREELGWRRSGKLCGDVTGPIAMHLSIADLTAAMVVSKSIPLNRLLGFTVTCEEDSKLLRSAFQGLWVDVYTMSNVSSTAPKQFGGDILKNLALSYVIDAIECSPIIKSFLLTWTTIGSALLGKAETATEYNKTLGSENLRNILMSQGQQGFSVFVREPTNPRSNTLKIVHHSGSRSRYSNADDHLPIVKSVNVDCSRGAGLISSSASGITEVAERKAELESQIAEKATLKNQADMKVKHLSEQRNEQELEVRTLKDVIKQLRAAVSRPKLIQGMIESSRRRISEFEVKLKPEREVDKKRLVVGAYTKAMDDLLSATNECLSSAEQCRKHRVSYDILRSVQDGLQDEISATQVSLRDARADIAGFKRDVAEAALQQEKARLERAEKEEELRALAEKMGGEETFISLIFPQVLEHCPETNLAEIAAKIGRLQALINASVDNPDLMNRYAVAKDELARLTAELNKSEAAVENVEGELIARKEIWLRAVRSVQEKLSKLFKEYMKELDIQGEVELVETGGILDYKMQILVSFRDSAPFSALSGHKHSGGERAVSTVMYLMALQELTCAPFRVVDEINQGMDERNERLVFDRIVRSCCGIRGSSTPAGSGAGANEADTVPEIQLKQYFLVTPKLLPGLRAMDNDRVSVLLIWSGPGVISKWQLPEIINALIPSGSQYRNMRTPQSANTNVAPPRILVTSENAQSVAKAIVDEEPDVHDTPRAKKRRVNMLRG